MVYYSCILLNASCRKESLSPLSQLQTYTGNIKFEFLPQSVEEVMSSQTPWESKSLNYYNIIKEDTSWRMFYSSFAYNQLDFDGYFCLAKSSDGEAWNRNLVNNNTNILIDGKNGKGITGSFVFVDSLDVQYHYKMICTKLVNNEQKTFLYASGDGITWIIVKQLFDTKQDSQFSVVRMNGVYYVFSRYNDFSNGYQRAIGIAKLDDYMNVIQSPSLLLEAPEQTPYPHIYNSAASKINDSTILLFPTYYNDDNGSISIKLIYTNNTKDYYLINSNINNYLFSSANVNWAIVSPGVIPTGEPDTYWVYYYTTSIKHNSILYSTTANIIYYRIKLKISF